MSRKTTPRGKAKTPAKKRARPKTAAKKRASGKAPRKRSGEQHSVRLAVASLRPVPVYDFEAGGLHGCIRLADPGRGVEFTGCLDGKALPGPCREVLSLRHYLARGEGGLLIPREQAECKGKVDKKAVLYRYEQSPNWSVAATARYDLLAEGGVDVTFAFTVAKGLRGFEVGIETLAPKMQRDTYVHTGGRWAHATAGPRLQRFYPRNMGAAELIADGRWNGLRMAGIGLSVEPQGYDYPMVVMWEPNTNWALAYMALTEECSSVWVNGAEHALGLGLVGADVKAKSTVTCRVRALLCHVSDLDDLLPHYRSFVQEARTTRKR